MNRYLLRALFLTVAMPVGSGIVQAGVLANDEQSGAIEIPALPFEHILDFVDLATTSVFDPRSICLIQAEGQGRHSVWYRYATGAAIEYVNISTEGSSYDTVVNVYAGAPNVAPRLVSGGCNDDGFPGGQSRIAGLRLDAETTHWIEVISSHSLSEADSLRILVSTSPLYNVTRTDDPAEQAPCNSNDCTLRAAVDAANAMPGAILLPPGLHVLQRGEPACGENANGSGDLDVLAGMSIYGAGPGITVIDARGSDGIRDRVFDIDPDDIVGDGRRTSSGTLTVHIADLTIRNGDVSCDPFDYAGGAIRSQAERPGVSRNDRNFVALTRVEAVDNQAGNHSGGFVFTTSHMHVRQSHVHGNAALGGGAFFVGRGAVQTRLIIEESTFSANEASYSDCESGEPYGGGAILALGDVRVRVSNSTLAGNRARCHGGGIQMVGGRLELASSTVARNAANFDTFFTGVGGGLYLGPGTTTPVLANTILADNVRGAPSLTYSDDDCFDTRSGGRNLSANFSLIEAAADCAVIAGTDNLLGTAPELAGELAANGGPTPTLALLGGSPAVDAGHPSACISGSLGLALAYDQRGAGYPRHEDGDGDAIARCDIGAYERSRLGLEPPGIPRLASQSDSGISDSDGVTNAETLVFEGACRNTELIRVFDSNPSPPVQLGEGNCLDARYSIPVSGMTELTYSIHAKAISGELISKPTSSVVVVVDRSIDSPVILRPLHGANVLAGELLVGGRHNEVRATVSVTGATQSGDAPLCDAAVNEIIPNVFEFSCTADLSMLDGPLELSAMAVDVAGNVSAPSTSLVVNIQPELVFSDGFDPAARQALTPLRLRPS